MFWSVVLLLLLVPCNTQATTPGNKESLSWDEKKRIMEKYLFRRDVVRKAQERADKLIMLDEEEEDRRHGRIRNKFKKARAKTPTTISSSVEDKLMKKAMPLKEYKAMVAREAGKTKSVPEFMSVNTKTMKSSTHNENKRRLEDGGDDDDDGDDDGDDDADDDADEDEDEDEDEDDDDTDDYYMVPDNMYGFGGYSFKFATCQKIQRFSGLAVANGEYSSLVTDDIVVFRLCPQRRCSSGLQYGCNNGYGEYAIGLSDYLAIMLRHEIDKQRNLCGFCVACTAGYASDYYGYRNPSDPNYDYYSYSKNNRDRMLNGDDGDDGGDDGDDGGDDEGDDAGDDGDDYYAEPADDNADDNSANDDGSSSRGSYQMCSTYSDLCEDYQYWCDFSYQDDDKDDDDNDDDANLDPVDYINFFDCVGMEGEDNYGKAKYWISPWCDPYSDTIKMGIFYDPYCSQYAGNEVNLNDFSGIYFQPSVFQDFSSNECVRCDSSEYPPYFNSNNNMCNTAYLKSGKCDIYLAYALDDDDSSATEQDVDCAYIESIRYGTYDALGQIYVSNSQFNSVKRATITWSQRAGLVLSGFLCCFLALYSCYLHHQITNVLLRSIAHGHLLPMERGAERNRTSRSSRSRASGRARSTASRSSRSRRHDDGRKSESDWDHDAGPSGGHYT